MLVHAELTLGFFPDENAAVVNTETTTKLSNPVRINFAPQPAGAELAGVEPAEAGVAPVVEEAAPAPAAVDSATEEAAP